MLDKRPKTRSPIVSRKSARARCTPRWCARTTATGEAGARCALHRRVRLPVPEDRASAAIRVAPRLRHRGPRRKADRDVFRQGLGQGAGRHLHAGRAAQQAQLKLEERRLRRDLGAQSVRARSRRAAKSRWTVSFMRSASAMSARPPRGAGARLRLVEAFHDAGLKIAKGDAEAAAEMDALDQIGDDRGRRRSPAYFGESHNRGIVDRLVKQVTILDAEKPKTRHRRRRQDRGVHRLAGEDDARRGQGDGRTAGRQGRRARCRRRPTIVVAGPGAGSKLTDARTRHRGDHRGRVAVARGVKRAERGTSGCAS